jgi:hypothetical protein
VAKDERGEGDGHGQGQSQKAEEKDQAGGARSRDLLFRSERRRLFEAGLPGFAMGLGTVSVKLRLGVTHKLRLGITHT